VRWAGGDGAGQLNAAPWRMPSALGLGPQAAGAAPPGHPPRQQTLALSNSLAQPLLPPNQARAHLVVCHAVELARRLLQCRGVHQVFLNLQVARLDKRKRLAAHRQRCVALAVLWGLGSGARGRGARVQWDGWGRGARVLRWRPGRASRVCCCDRWPCRRHPLFAASWARHSPRSPARRPRRVCALPAGRRAALPLNPQTPTFAPPTPPPRAHPAKGAVMQLCHEVLLQRLCGRIQLGGRGTRKQRVLRHSGLHLLKKGLRRGRRGGGVGGRERERRGHAREV
jgi:hypothetical protein